MCGKVKGIIPFQKTHLKYIAGSQYQNSWLKGILPYLVRRQALTKKNTERNTNAPYSLTFMAKADPGSYQLKANQSIVIPVTGSLRLTKVPCLSKAHLIYSETRLHSSNSPGLSSSAGSSFKNKYVYLTSQSIKK